MNRREFIQGACLTGIGIVAGTSIINSLGIETLKASPRPGIFHGNREIPLLLADTPELQTVGGAYHLEIDEIDKNILIAHTGEETFVAVDIKCTHKGCEVKYEDAKGTPVFACPCHDSKFDMNGVPQSGPAKKPLGTYRTSFKDGEVTIHIPLEDDSSGMPKDSTSKITKDSTMKK
jgi:Rieske Fe-S protein